MPQRFLTRFQALLPTDVPYIVFLATMTILSLLPLLFGGEIIAGDERIDGYYAYSAFFDRAIAAGESFLWNPHSYGGFPSFINQFGAFLFPPVHVLFMLLPAFTAFHLSIALALFGGLVCSYYVGRSLGLSCDASFILAASYGIAQIPGTFHLGLSYAHSFFVLPLLLLCLVQAKKTHSTRSFVAYVALSALASAIGFLAGYFVTFIYGLIFAGFFALFLDFFGHTIGFEKNWRALITLFSGFAIGCVAGLPQLIPLFEYQPYISRTTAFAQEAAVGSGVQLLDIIRIVLPYHFQFPLDPGRGYFYFGLVPLVGIIATFVYCRKHPLVIFFSSLYVIFLMFAMNAPLFEWINVHVPPFSRIGSVSRWLLAGAFAPAFLAGYGYDRLSLFTGTRIWKLILVCAVAGIGLLALLQIPLRIIASSESIREWIFMRALKMRGRTLDSLRFDIEHYTDAVGRELQAIYETFSFGSVHFIVFIVCSYLTLFFLYRHIHHQTSRTNAILIILTGVAFVASFAGGLGNTVAQSFFFSEIPAPARVMLKDEPSEFRYVAFQGDRLAPILQSRDITPEDRILLMRELLYREVGSLYGLRNIAGFEPIRSKRQNQVIDAALSPLAEVAIDIEAIKGGASIDTYTNSVILKKVTPVEKVEEIEKRIPLLSMMNVKYVLSLYPLSDKRLTELQQEKAPGLLVDYHFYTNDSVLPKIYFTFYPELWKRSERDLFIAMLETPDFLKKTYIECAECEAGKSGGSVAIVHEENGVLIATTTSLTGGWLVYSESNLPGWIATIDGERVPIRTANYLFQTIEIPAGEHEVEFRYLGSFALFLEKIGFTRRQ